MKIPPKKPHFLKPIQPGFKNGLKIPIGFLKYLKGYDQHEHAILTRAGKKWLLKLNGHRFEEGWGKFVEEHNVQLGDMLVFRHEGNMEFEVSIFDSTHCDREYAEYMQIQQGGETSKKFEFNDKPNPCIVSSSRAFYDAEEASTHFVFTVKPYCLRKGYFCLPKKFALANGFARTCDLVIRDERQRSWNLRLTTYGSDVYIVGGWKEFRIANGLKVGDHGMFEVVTNGEKPCIEISRQEKSRENASIIPRDWLNNEARLNLSPTLSHATLTKFVHWIYKGCLHVTSLLQTYFECEIFCASDRQGNNMFMH